MGLKRDILIGLGVLGAILLIISILVGLIFLLSKAIGLLIILAGIFMMFFFPDLGEFQEKEFSRTGIIFGIVLILIGVWLLIA